MRDCRLVHCAILEHIFHEGLGANIGITKIESIRLAKARIADDESLPIQLNEASLGCSTEISIGTVDADNYPWNEPDNHDALLFVHLRDVSLEKGMKPDDQP